MMMYDAKCFDFMRVNVKKKHSTSSIKINAVPNDEIQTSGNDNLLPLVAGCGSAEATTRKSSECFFIRTVYC